MHLVLKVALFAFEIFRRVALESVGNLSAGSLVMKRSDLHYTREGSRLLTEAFVMVLTFRFAEISSRLSSLALFSVATRKAFQSDNFFDVAGGLRADVELNTSDWSTLSATCGLAGAILLGGPLSTEQQSQLELCNSFGSLFHEPSLGARFSFYNPCVALLHMALGAVIWHGWGGFLFSGLGQKVLAVQCLFSDAFLAPLPLGPGAKDQILKYVNFIKFL